MTADAPRTFAAVIAGHTPVHRVYEDQDHLAFLAPEPVQPGHVILTTKQVHDYLFDLPPERHAALWAVAQLLAQRLRQRLPCARVCTAVVGWAVRHVHVHLVPTNAPGQFPPLGGPRLDEATLAALAARLQDDAPST